MTADLRTQLETYTAAVAAEQEEISVAEVHRLLPTIRELPAPPSHDRRRVGRGLVAATVAAIAIFLVVGGLALLTRSDRTVEPATPPTTLAPPEPTPSTLIPSPAPESLNRSQMEHQIEFLDAFQERGFLRREGCTGPEGGPFQCAVQVYSPTLGGPATKTFTVQGETGQEPDEPVLSDDMEQGSLAGAAVRGVAEEGLAELYGWALETYPDQTAARCGVGFAGDESDVAWSPGYAANFACGDHLAGLVTEFNPAEAPQPLEPDPDAGLWSRVDPETPVGSPPGWVLFDVADTPVGLLATGVDGLWISQDAVEWRPYARNSIEFDDGVFSKIAVSDLGIVVTKPSSNGPVHVWFSPDGEEWAPIEALRPGITVSGTAVTANAAQFLAVNWQYEVMSSPDGTNWRVVEALEATDFAPFFLVEATPFGFYASATDGTLWTSVDGVEWSQIPSESFGATVTDIGGSQSGLVAVTLDGRLFHSAAGAAREEVHTILQIPGEEHICTRIGASEVGFLVVAQIPGADNRGKPEAWFSEDGRTWSLVPTGPLGDEPEAGYFCHNEVIPFESGFLSVTDRQLGGPQEPVDMVWVYER